MKPIRSTVVPEAETGVLVVAFIRFACLVIWTGAIIYSTYQVYLAAEEHLPWQSDPKMNPGPLVQILGRGRDTTDVEWYYFTKLFCTKLIFWYLMYIILTSLVPIKHQAGVSIILSFAFFVSILNFVATMYIFLQPVLYWIILQTLRKKAWVWIITFTLLYSLNFSSFKEILFGTVEEYFFDIGCAWTYARCVSFTFDRWKRSDNNSIGALFAVLSYCFYFPTVINGPLILYNRYETDVIKGGREKNPKWRNRNVILKSSLKLFVLLILNEAILHYIYFRPLSLSTNILKFNLNLWALCGTIFWLGQFFMLKYQFIYGTSTCVAEFDGIEMPRLPRCPAYIHRYSVLWKDFDRGLYNFLVQYTYLPVIDVLDAAESCKTMPPELKKLIASLFSYMYVLIWHGVWFPVFIWAVLNFIGINIERMGSFIKRRIETQDGRVQCSALFWDVLVEPLVTIPLAAMSILNSVVFCGSLEAAIIFAERLLWTDVNDSAAFLFLLCFTQLGVTVRTWSKLSPALKKRIEFIVKGEGINVSSS